MPDWPSDPAEVSRRVAEMRQTAVEVWKSRPLAERMRTVGAARHAVAADSERLIRLARTPQRVSDVDTMAAECLPLCDALKFLQRRGARVLAARRLGVAGRPLWLWGSRGRVQRDALGVVLVLGAWNYPLFLGGVQTAQALAAGNAVLWKPAPGSEAVCQWFVEKLIAAGVPEAAVRVLPSDVETARTVLEAGVDLVVLTGSAATGRTVLRAAAETLTPAIMELSGCDAAIVLPSANLERAAKLIRFGLTINSGATCIGPRRLFLETSIADALQDHLDRSLADAEPVTVHPAARRDAAGLIEDAFARGARDRLGRWDGQRFAADGRMYPLVLEGVRADWPIASADLFAPVTTVQRFSDTADMIARCNDCSYGLAAAVFGDRSAAQDIADKLCVGTVTINDLVAPTADPRAPFGGRRQSGFGVTRGAEGLVSMTAAKVIIENRRGFSPHADPVDDGTLEMLRGAVRTQHGRGAKNRLSGLRQLIRGIRAAGTRANETDQQEQP
ncbi:aldehyde dehydrogenase family protein [Roseimaritima sediminicola]|uniref:aldehyde dehydrogenase family protein n=1 Tax=Roseimaritima sediminicola TaxID=2662066 RepID=UPI00129838F3|nr:aldehyde dehydrogenase family protein [Roseimaritima sediminicola]